MTLLLLANNKTEVSAMMFLNKNLNPQIFTINITKVECNLHSINVFDWYWYSKQLKLQDDVSS